MTKPHRMPSGTECSLRAMSPASSPVTTPLNVEPITMLTMKERAAGVKTAAAYARRAIEHATILDDAAAKENAEGKPLTVNGKDVQPWWNEP